ncbi:MAG: hypothetical protein E6J89_13365 [Deltaproteobacteria bacterium]|nr:MAG: hypothetical protein E6J89_13365 [Deltaproteobacteria bacterium]
MKRLRVLITNNTLADRAGTELYVRDLAIALLERGHTPVAYSSLLGEVARELRGATIPVVDHLDALAVPPDIIHGHHHLETMTALLSFPGVPAIYFCHGWIPWEEAPPQFPRIVRYIAVDHTCRDRLIYEHAIREERVELFLNFVDLNRFRPRDPLPDRPRRALVFSNNASNHTHLGAIREACAHASIELDVIGAGAGNVCVRPEDLLRDYDIVFAKGRSALEALAVGAAVVLCDAAGAGPMVTTDEVERLRPLNFGIRALRESVNPDVIAHEIARYDAKDAAEVSRRTRAAAGLDTAIDKLLLLYQEVIEEYKRNGTQDQTPELRAAATYLRRWVPNLTAQHHMRIQCELLKVDHDRLRTEEEKLRGECDTLRSELGELRGESEKLRTELTDIQNSSTMRLRNRLVATPVLGPLAKSLAKLVAGRAS